MKLWYRRSFWFAAYLTAGCGCSLGQLDRDLVRGGASRHAARNSVLCHPRPRPEAAIIHSACVELCSTSQPASQPDDTAAQPGVRDAKRFAGDRSQAAGATTRPARQPYTSPSLAAQKVTLLVAPSLLAAPGTVTRSDRVFGEAGIRAPGPSLLSGGRPGLAAPAPRTLNAVNSIPGLQRGPTAGLGFAARHTILTAGRNPTAGACQRLIRAGFFPNQAACRNRCR